MSTAPVPDEAAVTFHLSDRGGRLTGVRLVQELGLPGPLDFERVSGGWRLRLPLPPVDRMEYLLEVTDHNGNRSTITDPGNPGRAPGAFGDKSVVEFAGYRPPSWLDSDPVAAAQTELHVDAAGLDASVTATVWAPDGLDADQAVPLVVVHDGPEYAKLGGLTRYLGVSVATGALPPVRAALLDAGDRNQWYSAQAAYARAVPAVLRRVDDIAPATVRIGLGVSLGALAMLHAHRSTPGAFDALMLQSGSFFTPALDPQESTFSGFDAVTRFVEAMHSATADPHPVPAVLTCGTVEENLANNVAMAATLRRLGYPTELVRVRDAHNFGAWRDALDPHLTGLILDVVGARAT
jgi:enterochelin esterase-like enzyme